MSLLEVEDISASYGMVQILWDVSIRIEKGEIVTVIGPNGAGKTTLVNTMMGLVHPTKGIIRFKGENIEKLPPYQIVKRGISLIPEGRKLFTEMTVKENLLLGAHLLDSKETIEKLTERNYQAFPILKNKEKALTRTLSGGEQQMLVIARGLMSNPELLILDEPTLGLAPLMVERTLDTICKINDDGVTILLVEENIHESLEIADRGYVLEEGRIVKSGESKELLSDDHIRKVYLGI